MKITMPYIGRNLSVNYYRVRGLKGVQTNKIKQSVMDWMEDLALKVRNEGTWLEGHFPSPLIVEVFGRFRDGRVPDMDNLAKVILDAVKRGTGVDDRYIRFVTIGFSIGWLEPELDITIKEV